MQSIAPIDPRQNERLLRLLGLAAQADQAAGLAREKFTIARMLYNEARQRRRDAWKTVREALSEAAGDQMTLFAGQSAAANGNGGNNGQVCEPVAEALRELHPGLDI